MEERRGITNPADPVIAHPLNRILKNLIPSVRALWPRTGFAAPIQWSATQADWRPTHS